MCGTLTRSHDTPTAHFERDSFLLRRAGPAGGVGAGRRRPLRALLVQRAPHQPIRDSSPQPSRGVPRSQREASVYRGVAAAEGEVLQRPSQVSQGRCWRRPLSKALCRTRLPEFEAELWTCDGVKPSESTSTTRPREGHPLLSCARVELPSFWRLAVCTPGRSTGGGSCGIFKTSGTPSGCRRPRRRCDRRPTPGWRTAIS